MHTTPALSIPARTRHRSRVAALLLSGGFLVASVAACGDARLGDEQAAAHQVEATVAGPTPPDGSPKTAPLTSPATPNPTASTETPAPTATSTTAPATKQTSPELASAEPLSPELPWNRVGAAAPIKRSGTRTADAGAPAPTVNGCASRPSACGYPDETNTGVSSGVALKQSGCIHATTPGQVISGVWVKNCTISIEAPNVVIRDVKVTNTDLEMWAIIVREGASATFSNVEVAGNGQGTSSVQYAILSQTTSRVTIDRADMYNCADCVQGENIVMTNSYIHDLANPPGAHVDGFQCNSSCGVTLRHNTILNSWSQTSAIALFADFGSPRNSLLQDNLLAGGGYTVYGGTSVATGIRILDNRFARLYYPSGGYWGYIADFRPKNTGNEWSGNVWDDTGASVGS